MLNKFKEINIAYEVLGDDERKSGYDKKLELYDNQKDNNQSQEFPTKQDFEDAQVFLDIYFNEFLDSAQMQIKDKLIYFRTTANEEYTKFAESDTGVDTFVSNTILSVENYLREQIREIWKDNSLDKNYSYSIPPGLAVTVNSSSERNTLLGCTCIFPISILLLVIITSGFNPLTTFFCGIFSVPFFGLLLSEQNNKPDDSEEAQSAREKEAELSSYTSKIIKSALCEYSSRLKLMTEKTKYYRSLLVQDVDISNFKNLSAIDKAAFLTALKDLVQEANNNIKNLKNVGKLVAFGAGIAAAAFLGIGFH